MTEQEFHQQIDALFLAIEDWLESADSEVDFESQEGILTIFLPRGQIILSRQPALKEIWLAAPVGAYHFRLTPLGWVTSQQEQLLPLLADILKRECHVDLNLARFRQQ